jgi:hypothetical protein
MRTEEYIIILVGVVTSMEKIEIIYSSNAPENRTTIKVIYSNGQTVKVFDNVKETDRGVLTMPAAGLMPGTYTCTIAVDNGAKDSKEFVVH